MMFVAKFLSSGQFYISLSQSMSLMNIYECQVIILWQLLSAITVF